MLRFSTRGNSCKAKLKCDISICTHFTEGTRLCHATRRQPCGRVIVCACVALPRWIYPLKAPSPLSSRLRSLGVWLLHRHPTTQTLTDTRPCQLSSTLGCYAINNWTNSVTAGTLLHKIFLYDRRIVVVHTNKIKPDNKQINMTSLSYKARLYEQFHLFLPEAAHTI